YQLYKIKIKNRTTSVVLFICYYMYSTSKSRNSEVLTSDALSINLAKWDETVLFAIVVSIDLLIKCAASCQPRCSNISTADKITDDGLTTSNPAYFGAVPCVASKIACPVL